MFLVCFFFLMACSRVFPFRWVRSISAAPETITAAWSASKCGWSSFAKKELWKRKNLFLDKRCFCQKTNPKKVVCPNIRGETRTCIPEAYKRNKQIIPRRRLSKALLKFEDITQQRNTKGYPKRYNQRNSTLSQNKCCSVQSSLFTSPEVPIANILSQRLGWRFKNWEFSEAVLGGRFLVVFSDFILAYMAYNTMCFYLLWSFMGPNSLETPSNGLSRITSREYSS